MRTQRQRQVAEIKAMKADFQGQSDDLRSKNFRWQEFSDQQQREIYELAEKLRLENSSRNAKIMSMEEELEKQRNLTRDTISSARLPEEVSGKKFRRRRSFSLDHRLWIRISQPNMVPSWPG